MAFMVIHLWGKFWMAAWRGRRALTWITGVVAFVASVVECFTGYLSQQNFDSQWISTSGKDAINAVGVGAFFNLMNFGQMLLWHVVLIPVVLVAIVGAHVLPVRVRGVVHPLPVAASGARRTAGRGGGGRRRVAGPDAALRHRQRGDRRHGGRPHPGRRAGRSAVLSRRAAGHRGDWAKIAPADFVGHRGERARRDQRDRHLRTAVQPHTGSAQSIYCPADDRRGAPADRRGADLRPCAASRVAPTDPALAAALAPYQRRLLTTQAAWNTAYAKAVTHVTFRDGSPSCPRGRRADPGPDRDRVHLGPSGALDADLIAKHAFYGTDFTKPLLFLEDGKYFSDVATADHLTGAQWGVMNETGSYPGQPWLWLYTLWYQVPGFDNSANVDLIAIYMTGLATILLLAVPFIPGLRDIPR